MNTATAKTDETRVQGRGLSLHIGLNYVDPAHYAGWDGELNACEFDAEDMRAVAEAQGFVATSLIREQATREAVSAAILDAAAVLTAGDMLLISYAGHGGQVDDTSGDDEDRYDETWCLYNGQLLDDELFELWGSFAKGVRVHVVSDSCHSGTMLRSGFGMMPQINAVADPGTSHASARKMPRQIAKSTYRQNQAMYDDIQTHLRGGGWDIKNFAAAVSLDCTVRLFSGCKDAQFSSDGSDNGLFTEQLLRIWSEGRFTGDHESFYKAVLQGMPDNQTPQHATLGTRDAGWDAQRPFDR